jgi:lipopolysaccharide transport system ATP-binding protein
VGTGFHPELTGRENIFLNGAILGMQREEIRQKFDEIVDFAEIERFLDTPVKRYSSGMYVRLAFAVAAHLEPEILIVDEVLAVGDAQFQKKCLGEMEEVGKEGRTVLFVSHNMGAISKLCEKTLLLDSGNLIEAGVSQEIVRKYMSSSFVGSASRRFLINQTKIGQVVLVRLLDDNNSETTEFSFGKEPHVEVHYQLNERIKGLHVACIVSSIDGNHIFSTADTDTNSSLFSERLAGYYVASVKLPTKNLNTGVYQITIGLGIPGVEIFDRKEAVSFTIHDMGDFGTFKEGSRRAGLLIFEVPWYYQEKS